MGAHDDARCRRLFSNVVFTFDAPGSLVSACMRYGPCMKIPAFSPALYECCPYVLESWPTPSPEMLGATVALCMCVSMNFRQCAWRKE